MTTIHKPNPSMQCGPEAKRMSDRMSEIGAELAKYPFGNPNTRELEAELSRLKANYPAVLESGK